MNTPAKITAELLPDDPVTKLKGVGSFVAAKLAKLGIRTIDDLTTLLPYRFEDYTQLIPISGLRYNELCTIEATVASVHTRRSKRGVLIVQAKVQDGSGAINALWFNQRFVLQQLKPGATVLLWGEKRPAASLGHPFFVKKIIQKTNVSPVYPSTASLHQATLRRLVVEALESLPSLPDLLPAEIIREYKLATRDQALTKAHLEPSSESFETAKKLLAFEELCVLCLQAERARAKQQVTLAQPIEIDSEQLRQVASQFPFSLTDAQRRAAWQILQMLSHPVPLNGLLYGEVGSGKTAVAMLAASAVINEGKKVVWLNPTTILANQQAETARAIFSSLGLKVALVTAGSKPELANADIIIGTHAVLSRVSEISDIGLIIIDEQHRFGVEQRQLILGNHPAANLLMMTATPIPRSLAQTIFGHLDIIYLTDKPAERQTVETIVINEDKRAVVEKALEQKLNRNEPGYVICPLIDAGTSAATNLFSLERKTIHDEEKWLTERFPKAKVAIIHGRIKAEKRDELLTKFKKGEYDVLLSTTVVEVGIDNPEATWILIEEADRFGLSTLHQLRGRIGRGTKEATCYLVSSLENEHTAKRLELFSKTNDGLKIAEIDLEIRGPGELVGIEQSGLPELRYATLTDIDLLSEAAKAARAITKRGLDRYPLLKQAVEKKPTNEESRG